MRLRPRLAPALVAAAVLLAATAALALAGTSVVKHGSASVAIGPGQTRTLTVPYPDALRYGNARYSGRAIVLAPARGKPGRPPSLSKVRLLEARSVLGGSEYQARAHNANDAGTAAVTLSVKVTTLEPLPHS